MERLPELTRTLSELPKDYGFFAYLFELGRYPDDLNAAALEAKRMAIAAPGVELILRSAVAAGTTTDPTWASSLSAYSTMTQDWVQLQMAGTLLGQIPYRRLPFKTKTIVEVGAAAAGWVAAGDPIPVSSLNLTDTASLEETKLGTIVCFTSETFDQAFSPATVASMRESFNRSLTRAQDRALIDPNISAGAGPSSLTNGILPIPSTGAPEADIQRQFQAHIDSGSDLKRARVIMHPTTLLYLSTLRDSNGVRIFRDLTVLGGFILGVPVLSSTGAIRAGSPTERIIAVIDGQKILVADDGLVLVEASRYAALQMADNPSGAANVVSMMQTNSRALRVVRILNFERAHASAVTWTAVGY